MFHILPRKWICLVHSSFSFQKPLSFLAPVVYTSSPIFLEALGTSRKWSIIAYSEKKPSLPFALPLPVRLLPLTGLYLKFSLASSFFLFYNRIWCCKASFFPLLIISLCPSNTLIHSRGFILESPGQLLNWCSRSWVQKRELRCLRGSPLMPGGS